MHGSWIIGSVSFVVYLFFQAQGIFTGDSGDLVTAAALGGVPHPPGYPIYTLLGWLVSHVPLFTVSWRIALLSSFPHAMTVALVYALIYRMTKGNILASIFGAITLLTNYLFFLYSTTPEVFALFDLFIVGVWYALIMWREEKHIGYFYAAFFIYGLSFSHHHLMIFLLPAVAFFIWNHRHLFYRSTQVYTMSVFGALLGMLGFLPYLYIPIAARYDSIINWDRAVNISAFVRLVTRADYGTFVSGGTFGQTMHERLLAIEAYGEFIRVDWTWIGIGFVILGVIVWLRNAKIWGMTWIIAVICMGPLFFFYASFPIVNRFALGTYERFLLPSYVFFALASGVGFSSLLTTIRSLTILRYTPKKMAQIAFLVGVTFMIYPLSIGGMTAWRFWGLSSDRTAEYLGRDILSTATYGSTVLLGQDTPLFTTQYVRYVLGVRPDLAVIHSARLPLKDYQIVLKKHFPYLHFPSATQASFVSAFIRANSSSSTRVYSNTILPLESGWYWVSRGLLYEAVASTALPTVDDMYQKFSENEAVMHNPRSGILARYSHLMLSDVLDVYANAHIAIGKTLVKADKWEEARNEFSKAVFLSGDMSYTESLELLAVTQLHFKDCSAALASIQRAQKESYYRSLLHIKLESMTYGECFGDVKRAEILFSEYEKLQKASEQSLETL